MMSKAAKKALSKTVEMPEITKEILLYSDLEYAILCYLAKDVLTDLSLRQTRELPVIEVDSSDTEEPSDEVVNDCDEVVEVALRSLAPRTRFNSLRLV